MISLYAMVGNAGCSLSIQGASSRSERGVCLEMEGESANIHAVPGVIWGISL